jgi:hypothetical protein
VRPPPLPHQIVVLQRVLDAIAAARGMEVPTVVVFGLDGTLYDSRPRTLHILMEYAEVVRAEYPDVAEALDRLGAESIHPLLSDTLRECGLAHADLVRDVTNFWRERFYSDEYVAYDEPAEGAADYVSSCHEAGATVVYLACRDIPAMLLGTVAALRDHSFPLAVPGVELVAKPDATMSDEAFLRSSIPTLSRCGPVVGFFDSFPTSCNIARREFPEAHVALVETDRTVRTPEVDSGVELVTDFRAI